MNNKLMSLLFASALFVAFSQGSVAATEFSSMELFGLSEPPPMECYDASSIELLGLSEPPPIGL